VAKLLEKTWIEEHFQTLPFWKQTSYQSFSSTLTTAENTFPCIPAIQGFLTNHLRFSFIEDPRQLHSAKELAEVLRAYGKCSRDTGKYASLVVFFETPTDILEDYHVEDYRELFWTVLNHVTTFDEKAWPEEIPTDPSHHKWEFCFDGEPYFVFCATPAHLERKSRHFPCLMLAFQPRWVFEKINNTTVFGRNMKKNIRKRLVDYDSVPVHPDLKWYGNENNQEWKQYFLGEDDRSPSKCPFMKMKNKFTHFFDQKNKNE
jgi:uncharacterized protein